MTEGRDDAFEAKRLGQALAKLRSRAGLSQATAGTNYGITGQGWAKYETGQAPGIFKPMIQTRLAQAVGATRDQLLAERDLIEDDSDMPSEGGQVVPFRPAPRFAGDGLLPVRDRLQAGAWLLADDLSQADPIRLPAARDPRFPHAEQWLSAVVGDSVNLLHIYDGDYVQCVDVIPIMYQPRTGDIVEVERVRFDGAERELTIKQVEVTPTGLLLWPRSSNPRWKDPLELRSGVPEGHDVDVRIRGLVLTAFRRLH